MASIGVVAAKAHRAHEKAVEVVREHGFPERIENLDAIGINVATPRNPYELASFQAELVAALAEVVAEQGRRISELEEAAKSASSRKSSKK